jgi:hypothetical protein
MTPATRCQAWATSCPPAGNGRSRNVNEYYAAVRDAITAFEHYIADRSAPAMHRSAAFSAAIRDHDTQQVLRLAANTQRPTAA